MPDLVVRDLTVQYGRSKALRGVSVQVEAGEAVGIIGANGAGKTTLLSTIVGLKQPSSGSVTFLQQSLVGMAPERVARRGISLVPEGRRIFTTLTVAENLFVGASLAPRTERTTRIQEQYERFPILHRYKDSPAGRLSGGEQQQLAIARALLSRPRMLLLDEPSLGLAPKIIDLVFDTLEDLRRDGVTIVLVEQNAIRTLEFADRTYVLSTGTVEMESDRRDGSRQADVAAIRSLYLGGKGAPR